MVIGFPILQKGDTDIDLGTGEKWQPLLKALVLVTDKFFAKKDNAGKTTLLYRLKVGTCSMRACAPLLATLY